MSGLVRLAARAPRPAIGATDSPHHHRRLPVCGERGTEWGIVTLPRPVPVPRRFEGRSVVVTGAGTGFGAEIAVRAAQEGARVVGVHYRSSAAGAERDRRAGRGGGRTRGAAPGRHRRLGQIKAMADAAFDAARRGRRPRQQRRRRRPRADVVARHHRGVDRPRPRPSTSRARWPASTSSARGCSTRATAASSTSARRSSCAAAPGRPQYAAAKYGLLGAHEVLRARLRPDGAGQRLRARASSRPRRRWAARTGSPAAATSCARSRPMGRIPGPGRARRHRAVPGHRRRLAHDRRLHGRRRRLQHGRRLTVGDSAAPAGPRRWPEARALVQRAVDKAEQLGLRGGIAVVGASGALVTASRLDHGGPGGMARARSKAWISATQQIPSTEHLHRMTTLAAPISAGFVQVSPQAVFPGAGGMPVRDADGVVVGRHRGVRRDREPVPAGRRRARGGQRRRRAGQPRGPAHRLRARACPYVGQHGDDQRPLGGRASATSSSPRSDSLGMAAGPGRVAPGRARLGARPRATAVMAAAAAPRRRGSSVAVVDRGGDPIQQDRMDDAAAGGVDVALATAATAAALRLPQRRRRRALRRAAAAARPRCTRAPFLACAGRRAARRRRPGRRRPRRRRRRSAPCCADLAREVAGA